MTPILKLKGWAKRLEAAKKRGYFTDTDKKLAGTWETCAIGERILQDTGEKAKHDSIGNNFTTKAVQLGMDFFSAVRMGRREVEPNNNMRIQKIEEAIIIFNKIQKLKKIRKSLARVI